MNRSPVRDNRSLEEKHADRLLERQQQDEEILDELVKHPRCAIIPSPDELHRSSTEPGVDEIATREDFAIVWQWLTSSKLLNTGFYDQHVKETVNKGELLESRSFNKLVQLAFGNAFDAIRKTNHPDKEEMVLLYYSGHGHPIDSNQPSKSSFPLLEKLGFDDSKRQELEEPARTSLKFLNPTQKLKGGELLLHDVGFCDLQGLLTPFVAAVTKESCNARGQVKKNKHLVVIADSCYSGVLAQDVQKLINQSGPWRENGCSVTVQSACSDNETYGGYFTPCFVHFNKPDNEEGLQELKQEWNEKNEIEKNAYREWDLPSPCVETTMSPELLNLEEEDPIMVLPFQAFRLNLFRDPGFFKFCYLWFSREITREVSSDNKPRDLTEEEGDEFLEQATFKIIDYKLKKTKTNHNSTPMALFLVEYDPPKDDRVVCAHIDFKSANTDIANVSAFTLVEHERPKIDSSALFPEIRHTNRTNICENITKLVEKCKRHVDDGRWEDVGQWNMNHWEKLGVNNRSRLKERSDWMENYMNEIVPEK